MAEGTDDPASRRLFRGLSAEPLLERRVVYDPSSATLLLGGTPKVRGALPQLYYRRLQDVEYRRFADLAFEVQLGNDQVGVSTWALSNGILFGVIVEAGPAVSERVKALAHRSLVRFELQTHEHETWEARHGSLLGAGIIELLGAEPSGAALYAAMGFPSSVSGAITYELTRLSWSTGAIERLAPFDETFF